MRKAAALIALTLATGAFAQFRGEYEYPQFRGLTGLSGSGFAVDRNGKPSFKGAMAYSTPVGYTLGRGYGAAGLGLISKDSKLIFIRSGLDAADGNGTGFFLVGADLPYAGRLAGGLNFISGAKDFVINFQFSPYLEGPVQVAAGVMDFAGTGGASGTGALNDDDSSQSFFLVATSELKEGIHASAGIGNKRWRGLFANASANITPNLKALAEYDGFGLNYGLAFNPGPLLRTPGFEAPSRSPEVTMFLGLTKSKYASWSVVFTF